MKLAAATNKDPNSSLTLPDHTCQRLTLAQIESATRNFDESLVIGRGGFGKVYKSLTNFGLVNEVAIKRLNPTSNQGAHEFEAEVQLLSTLRHGNLVPLIGYCSEGKEMVLAYEFMPNGTLEDHLHKGVIALSWLQRLKICIGAARGLDYLHTGTSTEHGVIHRDVKTSNILLDSNFAAKISDFGLAKVGMINQTNTHVSTLVKGTFGYLDPSYVYSGQLRRSSDVYSFGVVLFEVLSGKKAVDPTLDDEQWSLAVWAQEHIKVGRLSEIVCPTLMGQISRKCLKEFASIAANCLHIQPKQRPKMGEVVFKLESILSQEKETAVSVVNDRKLISRVKYFFTSKTNLIPARVEGSNLIRVRVGGSKSDFGLDHIEGSKSDLNAAHVERSKSETDAHFIRIPYNPNIRTLSYAEFVGATSLDNLLYGGTVSLPWVARLKIAIGAADDMCFLHKKGYLAHSQFQTNCILVDKDNNARLRDYVENSSVSHSFATDAYYAAPEWFRYQADVELESTGRRHQWEDGFVIKSEIYSFGVVLLEILTGMKVFDRNRPEGKKNLVTWATPLLPDAANLGMILDPLLLDNHNNPPKGAFMVAELVSKCLQPQQHKRPSIDKILYVLQQCYDETMLFMFSFLE